MKAQTNIRSDVFARLRKRLGRRETVSGFIAESILREVLRRERGGKVVVAARKAGRPKGIFTKE